MYAMLLIPPQSQCIRLLDVEAAPPRVNDAPIISQLRVDNLEDRPQFAACLCPGHRDGKRTILCDSTALLVIEQLLLCVTTVTRKA